MNLSFESIYIISVMAVASTMIIWGLFGIRRMEARRLKKVQQMDVPELVEDGSLDEDIEHITRKRARESVEARFDVIRKVYVPLVVLTAAILIGVPLLPTLPATYVSLITGILAVLVGMAAKPVIENAIAGLVITFSQPIRLGDTVIIDEQYGNIQRITLLYTVLRVWDARHLVIPNHEVMGKQILNLSLGDSIWAYIEFFVSPEADMEQVKKLAKESMRGPYLDTSEPPSFWVMGLEKDAVKCWVAGWAGGPAAAWALKSSSRKKLVTSFAEHGINFQMGRAQLSMNSPISSRPSAAPL